MKAKGAGNSLGFIRLERRAWAENHLLAANASVDFQQFTDESFRKLRREYFAPADVVAEMEQRSKNKGPKRWRVPRKSSAN